MTPPCLVKEGRLPPTPRTDTVRRVFIALLNSSGAGADAQGVSVNDLVLVQGMRDTKLALARWNSNPRHRAPSLARAQPPDLVRPAVRRLRRGEADAARPRPST